MKPSDPQQQMDTPATRGAVMLPCEPDQFRDFIAGLLGKPQIIEQHFFDDFTVNHSDIQNLHHLLMQRMDQQHGMTLVHFTAKIIYDDNSNVLLNSFEQFLSYNEIRPLVSTAIVMTWVFLVKFADRAHPEKQEIEISFDATPDIPLPGIFLIMDEIFARERSHQWTISLRISHTARTWGADVEHLLVGHLEKFIQKDDKFMHFARKTGGRIAIVVGALLFLSLLFGILWSISILDERILQSYQSLADDMNGYAALHDKINYLVRAYTTRGTIADVIIVMIFPGMLLSMWIAAVVAKLSKQKPLSYLLLTRKAEERREMESNKSRWRIAKFAGSIGLGVVVGVLANYIFSWMVGGAR